MKTTNIIQRLSLFLLALVLTMPTWAQGTEVVSISSAADWKTFCQRVNDNGEPFLNAKLTQDVDLGGEIVMLGSVRNGSCSLGHHHHLGLHQRRGHHGGERWLECFPSRGHG